MRVKKQKPLPRGAGTLMAISGLPSKYGIGDFGKSAYDFVDFVQRAGQLYWQVLPLGPTSYGDSPYQSFSAFAGNPYFIDLDALVEEGLLKKAEVSETDWSYAENEVDYAALYEERFPLLKKAFSRSDHMNTTDYASFCRRNSFWLEDYALFMALKEEHDGTSWLSWADSYRLREEKALEMARNKFENEINFWKFCQYYFYIQWEKLKEYANSKNIQIIGDVPIYVALDSADVWANPELFQLDEDRKPVKVAGVPPDYFSATGQLWGNPLYDWDKMEEDHFAWWRRRIAISSSLYDITRIDHFIGIVNYYSIPADSETAMVGEWVKGPGDKLVAAISHELNGKRIIAEDLGIVVPAVTRLRKKAGYPGMAIYQYGLDGNSKNPNLPGFWAKDTVAYLGTHDNETIKGFLSGQKRKNLKFIREYLDVNYNRDIPWTLIRTSYASAAGVVIFQMQDYLEFDNTARMNTPSTLGCNWMWRLKDLKNTEWIEEKLAYFAELYGRQEDLT